jgi:hypothetical protein
MEFFCHYGEPALNIKVDVTQIQQLKFAEILMVYDATKKKWEIVLMFD